MQADKDINFNNFPENVFKNILYNLPIKDRENLCATSKYCHTNPTDPISLIIAILNSTPIDVHKLINKLKKHYSEFYNNMKNIKTYDPKNPSLFILRILIDNIKTLPPQEIEKVLQQELPQLPPTAQIDPKDWEKLTVSLRATYEANKHTEGKLTERSTISQEFINVLENHRVTYLNLANMTAQYTDFKSEKEKISFAYAYLVKANFQGACFSTFIDFQDANLSESNFSNVNFSEPVSFQNANLSKTRFLHRNLHEQDSSLVHTNFENANLEEACFSGDSCDYPMSLASCSFQNAKLNSTQFKYVIFYDTDFTKANLSSTQFENCDFENVKFINFKKIDAAKLKNQLNMLNTCKEQQKNDQDKKNLTKAIFFDFRSKIEKVNDLSAKKRLLETARHPIFGFSTFFTFFTFFTFYLNYFKTEEQKWIENQLKDFNANTKPEPR